MRAQDDSPLPNSVREPGATAVLAPPPSLTRRFAVLGAAVLCVGALFMVEVDRRTTEADISRWAEASNASLTIAIANAIWPRYASFLENAQGRTKEALRADPDTFALLRELRAFVAGLDVLKVKLYDLQGTTVFSSERGQIGGDYSRNERYLLAVKGAFASDLEHRRKFTSFTGPLTDRWVLSSYVPVHAGNNSKILGVAEIYRDVTQQRAEAERSRIVRMAIVGGALILVFGALVLIVWKSDRRLALHHRREIGMAASVAEANARSDAKSRFLANMGHELRTPLNAIIGFSDFIVKEAFGPISPRRYGEYASDINGSGQRLLCIINDILDIVNCEADRLELKRSRVPLADIVAASMRKLHPDAEKAGVAVSSDVDASMPGLYCDRDRMGQAVTNLLSNAIKFTPAGGSVRISAVRTGEGGATLTIEDTGIGVSAEDLPRIMEPFQQVDSTLARRYEGVGLGIPLARAIVQLHGGDLLFESEPGRGTTVRIVLPAKIVFEAEKRRLSA